MHARRSRDLAYALAAEWRIGKGRIEAEHQLADLIFIRFKHLRVMPVHIVGLRQRCGEPGANSRHRFCRVHSMRPHSDFCAAARRQGALRDIDACHEIAENIPQRSRAPVIYRLACAQIQQCAQDGGRSRGSVNSNTSGSVVAFDRF
jgi:hypothetical protein